MKKQIIIEVSEDFVPEEGDAFEAVMAALEHFEIPASLRILTQYRHPL